MALADRTYVIANGELRLTLTPADAATPTRWWRRTSRERSRSSRASAGRSLVDAIGLGAVYALMAVGIGLVFGVLRLVNFAYGQLIMAGAYALAFASQWDWPLWVADRRSASPS